MRTVAATAVMMVAVSGALAAHNGPPFPIVQDRMAGGYRVSLWTDPDTTDDGSAAGQFWVRLEPGRGTGTLPPGTHARVAVRPLDRPGPPNESAATPVNGDLTNQFAAVVLDHEGRFAVHVTIAGPLGDASVDSDVSATYNLRPPPLLLLVYLIPFVAIGALWLRVVARRKAFSREALRRQSRGPADR